MVTQLNIPQLNCYTQFMAKEVTRWLIDLGDQKDNTRTRAVKEIVRSGREDLSYVLRRVASRDKAPGVRYLARKGLELLSRNKGSRRSEKAMDISSVMKDIDSEDPNIRTFMALEAMRFADSSLIPYLSQRLRVEDDVYVVATLVKALGVLGSSNEINLIAPYLNHDDSRVRANALEGLNIIAAKGFSSEITPMISPQLSDPDHRVRINAIKALTDDGELDIFKVLKDMLDAREVWIRDSAIHAICSLGGEKMRPLLKKASQDPAKHIKNKALEALKLLENENSAKNEKPVYKTTKDNREDDSVSAVSESNIPAPTEKRSKNTVSGIPDSATYKETRKQVKKDVSAQKGIYQLISELESSNPNIRKRAVIALGRSADSRAFKHLMRMLDDNSKVVRYFAHRSIDQLEESTAGLIICPSCGFSFKSNDPDDAHSISGSFDSSSKRQKS